MWELQETQKVVQIETKTSEPLPCGPYGAPQGSVLAGVLHTINSNDFPACHSDCQEAESVIFVDDDSDNVHADTEENLQHLLQTEVTKSVTWLSDNRLCTAPDKTKIMILWNKKLKTSRVKNEISISIADQMIKESQSEKNIGHNYEQWNNF